MSIMVRELDASASNVFDTAGSTGSTGLLLLRVRTRAPERKAECKRWKTPEVVYDTNLAELQPHLSLLHTLQQMTATLIQQQHIQQ